MKTILLFISGIFVGLALSYFLSIPNKKSFNPYFSLTSDCKIDDVGYLRKGTIVRFDEGMSEGFDRYIIYLNLKGERLVKIDSLDNGVIAPYWLWPNTLEQ